MKSLIALLVFGMMSSASAYRKPETIYFDPDAFLRDEGTGKIVFSSLPGAHSYGENRFRYGRTREDVKRFVNRDGVVTELNDAAFLDLLERARSEGKQVVLAAQFGHTSFGDSLTYTVSEKPRSAAFVKAYIRQLEGELGGTTDTAKRKELDRKLEAARATFEKLVSQQRDRRKAEREAPEGGAEAVSTHPKQ